jgi:hypothetical protein
MAQKFKCTVTTRTHFPTFSPRQVPLLGGCIVHTRCGLLSPHWGQCLEPCLLVAWPGSSQPTSCTHKDKNNQHVRITSHSLPGNSTYCARQPGRRIPLVCFATTWIEESIFHAITNHAAHNHSLGVLARFLATIGPADGQQPRAKPVYFATNIYYLIWKKPSQGTEETAT